MTPAPEKNNGHLPHNIVSILYSVKGMLASHLSQVEEGRLGNQDLRLRHAEEALKKVEVQVQTALEITKRLGDLVQQNTNGSSKKQSISPVQAWRAARKLLEQEFPLGGETEILERIPQDFPPILADPRDLQQIFYEIAKNSIEAIKNQSQGKLIFRLQLGFSTHEDPFSLIQIADTGSGIPESILSKLFLPFYTTKADARGTGLGLYLTRLLVIRNRGRITASSAPGFGTTFTLEFPVASRMKSSRP